jgi:YD repeat-containing protein
VDGKLTAIRTRMSTDGTLWSQVSFGYDSWGNRTSETTYSGYGTHYSTPTTGARTTTTAYDPVFHVYPTSQTTPQGLTTTWMYDYNGDGANDYILGVPTKETDPNSVPTSAQYDVFGRLIKLIRWGDSISSPTLSISYQVSIPYTTPFTTTISQKISSTQSLTVQRIYDGMGRQTRVISGGVFSDTVYFSPTETHQSMPYFSGETVHYTRTIVNPSARTTTVIAPDGTQASTQSNGLLTTYIDARSNATSTTSDIWGRVVSVDAPEGPDVTYTYDELNRLKEATRGDVTTTLDYDHGGRKTYMSDPDMGTWTYDYDALGNLTRQTDARGQHICLYYDSLNRLTGRHYRTDDNCPSSPSFDVTYTYDVNINGIGRRTGMTDASGFTTWTYDERGRMISESKNITGAGTFKTSWTYNSADMPITMTYPGGSSEQTGEQVTYNSTFAP